jgi:hypothetical protein
MGLGVVLVMLRWVGRAEKRLERGQHKVWILSCDAEKLVEAVDAVGIVTADVEPDRLLHEREPEDHVLANGGVIPDDCAQRAGADGVCDSRTNGLVKWLVGRAACEGKAAVLKGRVYPEWLTDGNERTILDACQQRDAKEVVPQRRSTGLPVVSPAREQRDAPERSSPEGVLDTDVTEQSAAREPVQGAEVVAATGRYLLGSQKQGRETATSSLRLRA